MAKNKYGGINDMPAGWSKTANHKKVYALWFDMLRRCYDPEQQNRSKGKTYSDCLVCERWFSLEKFYSDIQMLPGYMEWVQNGKMSIDKDTHASGEKIYSPETCCFLPMSANQAEMLSRNPDIMRAAKEANKVRYALVKEGETLVFNSEGEACEHVGVVKCSVSSCYRRNSKCKGYNILRLGHARMDAKEDKQ